MKKRMAAIAMATASTLLFSACGGGGDSGGETKSEGNSGGQVELVVSHYRLEEERASNDLADAFLNLIEKFEEENPDIKVTQQSMSQADYSTKIQAQAAVNEMPDVFMIKGSWMSNFVENGVVMPLDEYLDSYEYKDKFREGAFDAATKDGKIYGLPDQLSLTSVVFYNSELWKQAGYEEFPTTWDEIFEAAEKFKEMGISTFSLGNKDKWVSESCLLSTIGDRYTGTEWTESIIANDGDAKFTDSEFVDALALLKKMADHQLFNADCNTISDVQAAEYYSQKQAAATVSGHWEIAAIESFADEEVLRNTKVALLPNIDGSEPSSFSGGCGWYIGINSNLSGEKLDAAIDFLFTLEGYEADAYTTETYGLIKPSIVDDVDMSKFSQLTQDFVELVNASTLTPTYDLQMDGAVIEVMNTGLQDLLNGTKEPETLAKEIQAEQDKL